MEPPHPHLRPVQPLRPRPTGRSREAQTPVPPLLESFTLLPTAFFLEGVGPGFAPWAHQTSNSSPTLNSQPPPCSSSRMTARPSFASASPTAGRSTRPRHLHPPMPPSPLAQTRALMLPPPFSRSSPARRRSSFTPSTSGPTIGVTGQAPCLRWGACGPRGGPKDQGRRTNPRPLPRAPSVRRPAATLGPSLGAPLSPKAPPKRHQFDSREPLFTLTRKRDVR